MRRLRSAARRSLRPSALVVKSQLYCCAILYLVNYACHMAYHRSRSLLYALGMGLLVPSGFGGGI